MSRDKGQQSAVGSQQSAISRRRRAFCCLLLAAYCLLFITGCRQDMQDQPRYEAYEASKFFKDGLSSRTPVEGTVPRGYLQDDLHLYTGKKSAGGQSQSARGASTSSSAGTQTGTSNSGAGSAGSTAGTGAQGGGGGSSAAMFPDDVDTFPFPVTREVVERGRERYQIFCSMCHGATGAGDGMIVRRGYKQPPSYFTEDLRNAPVGHFFDVITNGWGSMPRYSQQIPAQDRWAIIAYIRALQLSHPATEPDKSTQARPRGEGEGSR
ncbi:MAG TPA: cytochrome c [Pyrinomonadaceae bacterium]|jgi:mono/diheme cytochrome c family protein|nr:cytochrome c [Pyrinomonadaceae bacterium]